MLYNILFFVFLSIISGKRIEFFPKISVMFVFKLLLETFYLGDSIVYLYSLFAKQSLKSFLDLLLYMSFLVFLYRNYQFGKFLYLSIYFRFSGFLLEITQIYVSDKQIKFGIFPVPFKERDILIPKSFIVFSTSV